MSEQTAKKWIVISALAVLGTWWYRKWREGPSAVLSTPKFITAWGTVYFALALITEATPSLGGSFSILVMVGDLLANAMPTKGGGILADITGEQKGQAAAGSPTGGWGSGAGQPPAPATATPGGGQAATPATPAPSPTVGNPPAGTGIGHR